MRQLLILIPVVWLAACASGGPEAAAVASSDQATCTREARVGSRIVDRQCRAAEQVKADRVNAERTKDAVRSSVPRANTSVPGG
jgi:uncharacterized lipoprotein YmbA